MIFYQRQILSININKHNQIFQNNKILDIFIQSQEYTCIAYLKDVKKIAAGSNKANIRIWELKGGRCIKSYGYFKQDLQYDYMASDRMNQFVLASNCKMRRIRVWKLLENQQLEIENTFEGDLNNIQRMIHLGKDHVALLCFAQYFEGFKIFLQEIRVYNLISYKCVAKKQIHRGLFIVEPRSMLNVLNDKLLYYSSSVSIQKNTLYIWDYQTDQEVTFDFTVEKAENALFYSFNRIAVPYCLSFRVGQDDPCQSAQTGMYVKGPSGISVYDFQVKQIWKIQFEYDFLSEAVEMIDKHTLLFINSKNQMEWWNTQQNQLVKRVECKPNIFKSFKCVSKMLFMQNSNKEIVIWDSESLGCMQKKKTDQILQKIQVFEDKAYLLFQNGILERFDFKKGVTVKSSLQFALKDYVLIYPEIVIAGETLMQVLQVESIF